MAQNKKSSKETAEYDQSERIKRLVVIGIFSDDYLMERLVLKGGNALNLALEIGTRASVDVDLSMENDFTPKELVAVRIRLENRLQEVFNAEHFHVFDVTLEPNPDLVSPELAKFWGGYLATFKLIEERELKQCAGNLSAMRRNSFKVGAKGKFEIDISKFEYCARKMAVDLDGYQVFVYSTEMLVAEKLRAICQQMPEYGPVVYRTRPGAARARDFLDIHTLIRAPLDFIIHDENKMVQACFDIIGKDIDLHQKANSLILTPKQVSDWQNVCVPQIMGNFVSHYATSVGASISPHIYLSILTAIDNAVNCFTYTCSCNGTPRNVFYRSLSQKQKGCSC